MPNRTKHQWQTLPEWAREDIWTREEEFDGAFKRYDGLGKYVMQAEAKGATLQAAVESYASMETELRTDPIEGSVHLWRMIGLDPIAVATALADKLIPDGPRQAYEAGRAAGWHEGHVGGRHRSIRGQPPRFRNAAAEDGGIGQRRSQPAARAALRRGEMDGPVNPRE
jgi:hypothetical protein